MFHSIRWRIQLFHGLLLLVVLAGFAMTSWELRRKEELQRVDALLRLQLHGLLGMMHDGPDRQDRPPRRGGGGNPFAPPPLFPGDEEAPLDSRRPGPRPEDVAAWAAQPGPVAHYFRVWRGPEKRLVEEGGALAALCVPPSLDELTPLAPESRTVMMEGRRVREMTTLAPPAVLITVGQSLEPEQTVLAALAWKLGGLGLGVWVAAFVGGGWITRRALKPIQSISNTAARMSSGNLQERINVEETDSELGQLAGVLNETFARLQHAFDQQAQFTADAAHELRTPVSVVLSQAQLALSRERSPQEYREAIEACQRAAKRMQSLTESLLQLSRLEARAEPMQTRAVDFAEVASECVPMIVALAAERGVKIVKELQAAPCVGDEDRLLQVLTNLLSNALAHSADDGLIRVRSGCEGERVFVEVIDAGPGIAGDHIPHLFDRFYRADASRNRNTGGAGLGLAICKAILDAHRGSIEVTSVVGQGSTFRVLLPAREGSGEG